MLFTLIGAGLLLNVSCGSPAAKCALRILGDSRTKGFNSLATDVVSTTPKTGTGDPDGFQGDHCRRGTGRTHISGVAIARSLRNEIRQRDSVCRNSAGLESKIVPREGLCSID